MIPAPTVAGLHHCHDVTIDIASREVTLTRSFHEIAIPLNSMVAHPFWTYAEVYGPIATGNLTLMALSLDDHEVVFAFRHPIEFNDRFIPVCLKFDMCDCRFPKAGEYEMMLWVDGDIFAQRRFVVTEGDRR